MKVYYGVAHVQTFDGSVHACMGHGLAASGDEFVGVLIRSAREKGRDGAVLSVSAFEIPGDTVIDYAAAVKAVRAA